MLEHETVCMVIVHGFKYQLFKLILYNKSIKENLTNNKFNNKPSPFDFCSLYNHQHQKYSINFINNT